MNREAIDHWLERAQLGIVLAMLVFAPAAFGAVRAAEYVVLQWGVLAITALWLVRLWAKETFRFLLPPALWAALPFVAYAGWRYATADIGFVARQEFLQIAFAALLLFAIVNNLFGQDSQRAIAITLIVVATLLSMYGIYQWISGSDRVLWVERDTSYHGRGSATYICPNHFAGFVEMCLPLALALLFNGRMTAVWRVLVGYAAIVMFVGIGASGSRGGWVASFVSVVIFVAITSRRRSARWASILLALCLVGGGYWVYVRAIKPRMDAAVLVGPYRETRSMVWESAYRMWLDHKWTGVGPDHFDARYRGYRIAHDKAQARPLRAHNDYLNTLTDYGIFGLVLVLLPVGVLGWTIVSSWPHLKRSGDDFGRKRDSTRSALVLGAACGLIALLVHSLVDFNMHIPANSMTAVVLMAMIVTHVRFASSRWWVSARWPVRLLGSAALLAILFFAGQQTIERTRAAYLIRAAEQLPEASKEQLALLKRAASIEPQNGETAFMIGERLRAVAFQGADDYRQTTTEAMQWLERAIRLNRWDPYPLMSYGRCLDWLERHDEALTYFQRALALDPNHYQTRAGMAWHYFQVGDLRAAEEWNNKSIGMNWTSNPQAVEFREVINRAIAEEQRKKAAR